MVLYPSNKYIKLIIFNLIIILVVASLVVLGVDRKSKTNEDQIRMDTLVQLRSIDYIDEDFELSDLDLMNNEELQNLLTSMEPADKTEFYPLQGSIIFIGLVVGFFLLLQIINAYLIGKNQKKYIAEVNEFIDSVMTRKFDKHLKEDDEYIYSNLNNIFNKLGLSVKRNYENLNGDRKVLQDALVDISHQVKTPLAALSLYNEILLDSENLKEDQVNFLNLSQEQIGRMRWLIASLLKISKLEADTIQMNSSEFEIKKLSENMNKTLINNLDKSNLTIKETGDTNEIVTLDLNWTSEALLNIVKNATEHAKPNTVIEINYTVNVAMIRIDVTNKGPQIDAEDMPKIFQRFYKSPSNSNPESVGIGMNLAKKLVEKQYGTISVRNVNDGVMFSILFLK